MKIRKFTVILSFPRSPFLTGIALVHATTTLGAEAYAVALFPEPQCLGAGISALFPGWIYPDRSPNSFAISIRSYPVPLSGSYQALPATSTPATKGGDYRMK